MAHSHHPHHPHADPVIPKFKVKTKDTGVHICLGSGGNPLKLGEGAEVEFDWDDATTLYVPSTSTGTPNYYMFMDGSFNSQRVAANMTTKPAGYAWSFTGTGNAVDPPDALKCVIGPSGSAVTYYVGKEYRSNCLYFTQRPMCALPVVTC